MVKNRILILDDEPSLRTLLKRVLISQNYDVVACGDGVEGLRLFNEISFDLIISDIKMPKMDGIEFLHKIKELQPEIPFVLITAFATTETAIEALKSGAQDYITKPFDIEDIINVVEKLLKKSEENGLSSSDVIKYNSKSPKMIKVLQVAKQIANSDATVLITGETGTGKEVLANTIHSLSNRKDSPMIKVNCGAIPDNLLESELFGYEKGAFTGALKRKPGWFEVADKGTIFLDEIGDISPQLQVKLLRVLQERTIERLGGVNSIKVDIRIIAATNKNLKEEVEKGNFREDLFYRLNVVPILLPPLRERREDIEDLINLFIVKYTAANNRKLVSDDVLNYLKNYEWHGNIRELENIIARAIVLCNGRTITADLLPEEIVSGNIIDKESKPIGGILVESLDSREREIILEAIREAKGNKTKAAEGLGISRRSLHRKISKYGISDSEIYKI